MCETSNEITEKDLEQYGFVYVKLQHNSSLYLDCWINGELRVILIPNGHGYLPKYCPPMVVEVPEEGQPLFSNHGTFILTLEDLKKLIEKRK